MSERVTMPALGESVTEGTVTRWLKNVGDTVAVDEPRFRPGKRRARRGVAHWPLLVHVLLGIALGAAIVAAYSAYYGLPIP